MKINSLVDPELIEALYAASQAGVKIDLIVRGICCLLPGRARGQRERSASAPSSAATWSTPASTCSPTATGRGRPVYYIGSADLMPRNLDKRVEVLVPVTVTGAPPAARRGARLRAGRGHPRVGARSRTPAGGRSVGTAATRRPTSTRWLASGPGGSSGRDGLGRRHAASRARGQGLRVARLPGPGPPRAPSRGWSPADPTEQVLDARFLDAEDLRLLRMGITFRHRTGEGDPEGR